MQSSNNYFPNRCLPSSDNNNSFVSNRGYFMEQPPYPVAAENISGMRNNTAQNDHHMNGLRSVDEIPTPYRSIFGTYPYFNAIQSQVLDVVLHTDESIVVSAPTGSGKTAIFELAIVRFLISLENQDIRMPFKVVYVAPLKALCEERLVDWHVKFASLGLSCISATGDSENFDLQNLLNHNLIITTPEKWDSLTRRWRENKNFVGLVKLFMIDEVHLLGDEHRGPTLEAIVSRMKTIQDCLTTDDGGSFIKKKIRFMAASATIPNPEDIAAWLSMPTVQAKAFTFGDDMRPVQLKKVILGYRYDPQKSTPFKFDIMLNYKLESVMLQYAEGKPTLIFCSTRKNVEMTSKHITQNITIDLKPQQKEILQSATLAITDSKVKEMLVNGVSYHHAGLSVEDRKIIEHLFRNANLPILITTSTLAMGVNLPAHLVIIKSTKYYFNGEYRDYSECMLLQMIGRAGRPQFDKTATAVILTSENDREKYENMVCGTHPVESNMHKHLAEHLNAEVVLHTITDLGVAMQWLTSTFLYIRARKKPRYYGLPLGLTPEQVDKKLLGMCEIEINRLARAGMLRIDEDDVRLTPTETGLLMARYCVAFDTMKLFTQVTGNEILQQILALISKCSEFSEIYLRVNDKKTLNLLNKCRGRETIRFPLNGKIKTVDMKINCIIQAVFGCLQILEQSLVTESHKIMRIGERLSKCLAEYLEKKGNCYSALLSVLTLAKCFHARLWEDTPYVSKQLTGIGSAFSSALVAAEKTTFKDLLEMNPRDIERIINRKAPIGNTIQEQIKHLPDYEIILGEEIGEETFSMNLTIQLKNALILNTKSSADVNSLMNLLIGDSSNKILYYEKYRHSYFIQNPKIMKTFEFPVSYDQEIKIHLISEDWVGIDCEASFIPISAKRNLDKSSEECPTKHDNKHVKKPSHIQTCLDKFFKKCKTTDVKASKHKQEIFSNAPSKRSANKENIIDTSPPVNSSITCLKQKDSTNSNYRKPSNHLELANSLETNHHITSNVLKPKNVIPKFLEKPVNHEATSASSYLQKQNSANFDYSNVESPQLKQQNTVKFASGHIPVDTSPILNSPSKYSLGRASINLDHHQSSSTPKHLQRQNSSKFNGPHAIKHNESIENLHQSQTQVALQEILGDSIEEYKKLDMRQTQSMAGTEGGYYLPSHFLASEDIPASPASVVRSNSYSTTVKRASEANSSSNTSMQTSSSNEDNRAYTNKSIFKFSQVTPKTKEKKFNLRENMKCTVNFEGSLHAPSDEKDDATNGISLKFKFTPHKKYKHGANEFLSSQNKTYQLPDKFTSKIDLSNRASKNNSELISQAIKREQESPETYKLNDNLQKTITWRSPLIMSPAVKYSPTFGNDRKPLKNCSDKSFNLSFSSLDNNSTMDSMKNKTGLTFEVKLDNPSEISSHTSTTPSESNSIFKYRNSSEPTLKRNLHKNSSNFPLSDRSYVESLNQGKQSVVEDLSNENRITEDELISTPLLEILNVAKKKTFPYSQSKQNEQNNIGKFLKSPRIATVAEYYSQVVSNISKQNTSIEENKEIKRNYQQNGTSTVSNNKHKTNLSSQENSQKFSSTMEQQPCCSKSIQTNEQSFNESLIDIGNKPESDVSDTKSLLENCLAQSTTKSVNNKNEHFIFDFSRETNNFQDAYPNFENSQNPFTRLSQKTTDIINNLKIPEIPGHQRGYFSQNQEKPHFSTTPPHESSMSFSQVSQSNDMNLPRIDVRNHLGRYHARTYTVASSQPLTEYGVVHNNSCHRVKHGRHENCEFPNLNYYAQPNQLTERYTYHKPCCARPSVSYCCPRSETDSFMEQSQTYHPPQSHWATANNSFNFDHFHKHPKRSKLEMHKYAPASLRRNSFHDRANVYGSHNSIHSMRHRQRSFHEDVPSSESYLHEDLYPRAPELRRDCTTYNCSDKKFLLRRYLRSVEQKEIGCHANGNMKMSAPYILPPHLETDIPIDVLEAISDDECSDY